MNENIFKNKESEKEYFKAYDQSLSLWDTSYDAVKVATSFGSTHILVTGPQDGVPLILFHGFGFSSTMWYPNIKALSEKYRVYAIDVIGEFNRSIITKSILKETDYVVWFNEILNKLNIQQAVLVGHSNGGWHAINLAIHNQERVIGLVLLAPAASFLPFRVQFPIRLVVANIIRTKKVIINYFARWFVWKENDVDIKIFEQFYIGLTNFKWKYKFIRPNVFNSEEIGKLTIPILLLVGDKEVIYDYRKLINNAGRLLPHIKTIVIQNAGHALSIEKAQEVNKHIIDFLCEQFTHHSKVR